MYYLSLVVLAKFLWHHANLIGNIKLGSSIEADLYTQLRYDAFPLFEYDHTITKSIPRIRLLTSISITRTSDRRPRSKSTRQQTHEHNTSTVSGEN